MSNEEEINKEKEGSLRLKNVTIRGIDSEIYDEFSHSMKMLNMTIGDAVTKMMRDVIEDLDESFSDLKIRSKLSFKKLFDRLEKASVRHHRRLIITGKDLLEANAALSFSHIGELIISPDVTREIFNKHIRHISHCRTVRVPDILPKLLLLSRIKFCRNIEIYSTDNDTIKDEIISDSTPVSDSEPEEFDEIDENYD
ncbi:MAG: hypothetical protein ACFE95_05800 [Candidatus Hodarchaeota archaeon]